MISEQKSKTFLKSRGLLTLTSVKESHEYLTKLRRLQYQLENREKERLQEVERRFENIQSVHQQQTPKQASTWNFINRNKPKNQTAQKSSPRLRLDTPTLHKRLQSRRDADIKRRRQPAQQPHMDPLEGKCLLESSPQHLAIASEANQVTSRRSAPMLKVKDSLEGSRQPMRVMVHSSLESREGIFDHYQQQKAANRIALAAAWSKNASNGLNSSRSTDTELLGMLQTFRLPTLSRRRQSVEISADRRDSTDRSHYNKASHSPKASQSRKLLVSYPENRCVKHSRSLPTGIGIFSDCENVSSPEYLSINISLPRMQPENFYNNVSVVTSEPFNGHCNSLVSTPDSQIHTEYPMIVPKITVRLATAAPDSLNRTNILISAHHDESTKSPPSPTFSGNLFRAARKNEMRQKEIRDLVEDIEELNDNNMHLMKQHASGKKVEYT